MRLPAFLKRSRHGVYYLRWRIPSSSASGRRNTEYSVSLRTTRPRAAAYLSRAVLTTMLPTLAAMRAAVNGNEETMMSMKQAFRDSVCGWVATLTHGNTVLQIEANANDPVDQAGAAAAVGRIWQTHASQVLGHESVVVPAPVRPMLPTVASNVFVSIAKSIEDSLTLNQASRTKKTDLEFRRILNRFETRMSHLGRQTVAAVTSSDVAAYKQYLVGEHGFRPKTVNKHLSAIGTLFRDAQRAGAFPSTAALPTAGQGYKKKAIAKAVQPWLPLTRDDLVRVFDPDTFTAWRKPHEYFVPLIMAHHGLRVSEASQLSTTDIVRENKVWLLRVTDDAEGSTLKTDATKRVVPLHPGLIHVGLCAYVRDVREVLGKDGLLFPYLRNDSLNGYGDVPGEALNRYLRRCLGHNRKRSHSFRHTINEMLKQSGVSEEVRCEYVGHEHGTINSTVYAGRLRPAAMAKIVFPALELPLDYRRLAYRRRRFDAVIRSELARRRRATKRKTTAK